MAADTDNTVKISTQLPKHHAKSHSVQTECSMHNSQQGVQHQVQQERKGAECKTAGTARVVPAVVGAAQTAQLSPLSQPATRQVGVKIHMAVYIWQYVASNNHKQHLRLKAVRTVLRLNSSSEQKLMATHSCSMSVKHSIALFHSCVLSYLGPHLAPMSIQV